MRELAKTDELWRMDIRLLDRYLGGLRQSCEIWPLDRPPVVRSLLLEALREAENVRAARGDQLQLPLDY